MKYPLPKTIDRLIETAMHEDRVRHDITTRILVDKKKISQAYIISRQNARLCGVAIVRKIFKKFDPSVRVYAYHKDGDAVNPNEPVIYIQGPTSAILSCERITLNFLGHLSGIATLTSAFVEKVKGTKARILDTRKTTIGFRDLEKYAVRCGGGDNHRRDLSDMVLIKDNHLLSYENQLDIPGTIKSLRKKTGKLIEIEVDTLDQFCEALNAGPDIILLDNMTTAQIKKAVFLNKKSGRKILLEASGNVRLDTVSAIAKTGVDRISVGQLTHSAKNVDFSMEFVK